MPMRVLQINKFLYPRGGAEAYMFQLTDLLRQHGLACALWGMANPRNVVEDDDGCLADEVDFSSLCGLAKLRAAGRTVYARDNAVKLGRVLDAFRPDIVHLHNYNFQLTPAILPEIRRRGIRVVHTAHDGQLVCPYHRFYNFQKQRVCEECRGGAFYRCVVNRCFDGSFFKSTLGAVESYFYHGRDYYNRYLDMIISPSQFLAESLRPAVRVPVRVVPNFTREYPVSRESSRNGYVLYFGRISEEKGVLDLQHLPVWDEHCLVISGEGPGQARLRKTDNIQQVGFQSGDVLRALIAGARYVIQPARWSENCPMTVIESFMCGTPVIAADAGGFKEMVEPGVTGFLIDFQKDRRGEELRAVLARDPEPLRARCREAYHQRYAPEVHLQAILKIYQEVLS